MCSFLLLLAPEVGLLSASTALSRVNFVNTLVYNFKPVKKVVLLVEGAERETLGGHVDLSRAFFPAYSLVER